MKKLLFAFLIGSILFAGCKEDDPKPDPTVNEELSGDITSEVTLDASVTYKLVGTLSVKDGGVLNIPAGTTIEATKGFSSYVIVEQGGKIMAQGTAASPITFTSAAASPAAGDWGGIWINGYAPVAGGVTGTSEVDATVPYGGSNASDNSGVLKYVKILYSGAQSSENVEHNGLTLDAVGNGTVIENIYVADGADDAIEFFGGTVNVTNLLAVNCDDDMFDVTQGWSGKLTNAYGVWEAGYSSTESDPRGIEADGNLDGNFPDQSGQSTFAMENVTIKNESDYVMEDGIKIRRGATATITNALLIGGSAKNFIDLTDSKGDAVTATSISLTVKNAESTDLTIKANETYDNVKIESGNSGASAAAFDWTGYTFGTGGTSSTLIGDISNDVELDPSVVYTLTGTVKVKSGAKLTIPAGTTIKAKKSFESYIIVEQGGQIIAEGTASSPITFTSAEASPAAGDWGGIWINGYAPISGGGTGTSEVDATLPYGGTNAADNSGILKYVVIAYSGAQTSENVEHNGLTLDAVGNGTVIENIYIYDGADDAVEFFGGTVDVKNLLAVNCDDDMFDVTQGWSGTLTNAYGIWEDGYSSSESDPRGIEADGNLDGNFPDQSGQSTFAMTNVTIKNESDYLMEDGIKIRRGATATITNALLLGGYAKDLIDVTDSKGNGNTATSISLTISKSGKTSKDIHVDGTYDNVALVEGNTGADASAFAWTGYDFSFSKSETLSGDVTEDMRLNGLYDYSLNGTLSVKNGATLYVPAGTTIKATKSFESYVIVEQGGKIMAEGTAGDPVTFTSGEASPAAGDWGGIWINGYAPISGGGAGTCEVNATLPYGGNDAADNSGVLKYVVIAYSGAQTSENVEHNGLTLDAVGTGTVIENLYVYKGADDAVEFFGGTVNVTNMLSVDCDDDMFDVTQGWSGTLDNAYGVWQAGYSSSESDPRGIEADGNLDGNFPDQTGQSNFTMSNVTIRNNSDYVMEDGIKIRRGATATVTNALMIGGQAKNLIDMTDSKGDATTASAVSLTVDGATSTSGDIKTNETYNNVKIESGNTGADAAAFSWTGFSF
ncbi:hypothetical protein [Maribellus sediminis]|uniref:hypothetical protein n=1 Tax=Maribellus sediminis TaxID=2696285 RepID=UPI00143100D1|nr:hypothetical protein [Maribellus sediminis]